MAILLMILSLPLMKMNNMLRMPSSAWILFALPLALVFNGKKLLVIDNLCILFLIGLLNSLGNGFKMGKYLNSLAFLLPFKLLLLNFGVLWFKRSKRSLAIGLLRNYLWLASFKFVQKFLHRPMFIIPLVGFHQRTAIKSLIGF